MLSFIRSPLARTLSARGFATKHMVVTGTGADRAGLVVETTALIRDSACNISESRSMKMGSCFSTLFQLQGTAVHPGPLGEDWTPDAIREELEDWAESVNCEVQFEDVDDMEDEDDESFGDDWDAMEMEKEFLEHAKTAEKKHLPSGDKK